MTECYLCGEPFTINNRSKEHILLNSIGGHLKSKKLLCKTCNSEFGHKCDTELSKQMLFLSNFLEVKRDSGTNPILKGAKTKDGKEYHILDGGKPIHSKATFEQYEENGIIKYNMSGRNEGELLTMLKGLKRKHPELDLEATRKKFQWKEEYLNEFLTHTVSVGGEVAFRSIAKTAVNFYIHTKNEKETVRQLFEYLKDKEKLNIVQHFYPTKSLYRKDKGEVIHLIHLVGNKHDKLLYCFVELFSSYSFIILLSSEFKDKNFTSTYCYNVTSNKVVEKQVSLKLKKNQLESILNMPKDNFKAIQKNLNRVLKIVEKIQTDKAISDIVGKSTDKIFSKYKHEPFITEQMINEFCEDVALAYTKFTFRGQSNL